MRRTKVLLLIDIRYFTSKGRFDASRRVLRILSSSLRAYVRSGFSRLGESDIFQYEVIKSRVHAWAKDARKRLSDNIWLYVRLHLENAIGCRCQFARSIFFFFFYHRLRAERGLCPLPNVGAHFVMFIHGNYTYSYMV